MLSIILDALDGRRIDLKHTEAADMSADSYSALGDIAFDAAMNELPAIGGAQLQDIHSQKKINFLPDGVLE
jgi:hypothetical protein